MIQSASEKGSTQVGEAGKAQRERILEALAEVSAEKGFARATIQEIVARARTSKRAFYRHFANKEEALGALVDHFLSDVDAATSGSFGGERPWPDGVRETIAALLGVIAAQPNFAKLAFLEPAAAGSSALDRPPGELALASLFDQAEGTAGSAPSPTSPHSLASVPSPASASRAARAGAQALIVDQLIADRAERLPDLLPEMVYIVLVPYLGQEEAVRQSRLAEKNPQR